MKGRQIKERLEQPWILLMLGALTFAVALVISLGGEVWPAPSKTQEDKVYSAVADVFAAMAVSTAQTGSLEPPGVIKPFRLFAVRVAGSPRDGMAVLGAAEVSTRTYVGGALLENGAYLTELYADPVILTRHSQRFTLYLASQGKSDLLASIPSSNPSELAEVAILMRGDNCMATKPNTKRFTQSFCNDLGSG